MPNFKSIAEMKDYMNKILIRAMDKVGDTTLQKMKDYVEEEMSERLPNQLYVRTNQFVESIDKLKAELKADGTVEVFIFYNSDKIEPFTIGNPPFESEQTWGWHSSFNDLNVSTLIPLWIDVTGTPNNPYYQHEPIGGIEYLEEWALKNFRNELKKELKKLNIDVK